MRYCVDIAGGPLWIRDTSREYANYRAKTFLPVGTLKPYAFGLDGCGKRASGLAIAMISAVPVGRPTRVRRPAATVKGM